MTYEEVKDVEFMRDLAKSLGMTVEKFLADGHKFVDGDVELDRIGDVETVGNWLSAAVVNDKCPNDDGRFILRAAALEAKEPKRTKEGYEKLNFECAWHAIKAFEDGEKLYTKLSSKGFILIDNAPDVLRWLYDLHERIETPIEWWEDACEHIGNFSKVQSSAHLNDLGFLHIEASMSKDQWCDFARIILEQGE